MIMINNGNVSCLCVMLMRTCAVSGNGCGRPSLPFGAGGKAWCSSSSSTSTSSTSSSSTTTSSSSSNSSSSSSSSSSMSSGRVVYSGIWRPFAPAL